MTFLFRFTPSLMEREALEAIFVQREETVQRILDLTRESALTPSKHHTLLIGPRGIGKTHLVSLIYHRVSAMKDLRDRLMIAWMREDEWGVTSLVDLLLRIFRALSAEYVDVVLDERVESLYRLPSNQVETAASKLLKEYVGDRTLLVLIENLDDVFQGLGDEGQKRLRAYIQENPLFTLAATAQSLFNGVSLQTSPFYGFFRIQHLEGLSIEESTQLLASIARYRGDQELASFIQTPVGRARIRAVNHLAGGNHRVYVIFSQFLTRESLDELVHPFMQMLDDLTPYYQDRMRWLSPQQRKIVEFLLDRGSPATVREIAQRCFMTPQTASSQLKVLREMEYVLSESIGRESYYELHEPLMRLCVQVKKNRGEPIKLFVDFLRLWYSQAEMQQRLEFLQPGATLEREYLLHALWVSQEQSGDPLVAICLRDHEAYTSNRDFVRALQSAEELLAIRGESQDWYEVGHCLAHLGKYEEALAYLDKSIALDAGSEKAWGGRGWALSQLNRWSDALECFDQVIGLDPTRYNAWSDRGAALAELGRLDEALVCHNKALELAPNDVSTLYNRGVTLQRLERFDDALMSYDKVVELTPKNAMAWANRGFILGHLGRLDEALATLDKAIELNPNLVPAWGNRGVALRDLGNLEESLLSFDKVISLEPKDHRSWYNKGLSLSQLGQYEEALRAFDKAIELGDDSLCAFFQRAAPLLMLNRWEEINEALDRTLEAHADAEEHIASHSWLIVSSLFASTSEEGIWRNRISTLISLYGKHQLGGALAAGLVQSITELRTGMTSEPRIRAWGLLWREIAGGRPEFELALRLLDVSIRYALSNDKRVLLELPIEERKLLDEVTGPAKQEED